MASGGDCIKRAGARGNYWECIVCKKRETSLIIATYEHVCSLRRANEVYWLIYGDPEEGHAPNPTLPPWAVKIGRAHV